MAETKKNYIGTKSSSLTDIIEREGMTIQRIYSTYGPSES